MKYYVVFEKYPHTPMVLDCENKWAEMSTDSAGWAFFDTIEEAESVGKRETAENGWTFKICEWDIY